MAFFFFPSDVLVQSYAHPPVPERTMCVTIPIRQTWWDDRNSLHVMDMYVYIRKPNLWKIQSVIWWTMLMMRHMLSRCRDTNLYVGSMDWIGTTLTIMEWI